MATQLNNAALRDAIRGKVEQHGSLRAAARVLKVSAPYLCRLMKGSKDWPDDKLLKKLGVRRSVIYWKLGEPQVTEDEVPK